MNVYINFAGQVSTLPFPLNVVEAHPALVTAASALIISLNLWVTSRNIILNNAFILVKEMQDLNLAVIKDQDLAEHYALLDEYKEEKEKKGWVRELYIVFYHLNLIHDIRQARRRRLLPRTHTLVNLDEIILITARRAPEQISFALKRHRGYHPSFKRFLRRRLMVLQMKKLLKDDWCKTYVPGNLLPNPFTFLTPAWILGKRLITKPVDDSY